MMCFAVQKQLVSNLAGGDIAMLFRGVPEISKGEAAIQKPRQLKLIDGTSFFACVSLCMASPPYLRVSLHSCI